MRPAEQALDHGGKVSLAEKGHLTMVVKCPIEEQGHLTIVVECALRSSHLTMVVKRPSRSRVA